MFWRETGPLGLGDWPRSFPVLGGREEEGYRIHQAVHRFPVMVFVPVFYFTIRKNIIQDSSFLQISTQQLVNMGKVSLAKHQSHILGAKHKRLSSAAKSLFVVTA